MSNDERLEEGDVKGGLFQRDSLSPLLFVSSMVPPLLILGKVSANNKWGKKECKVNHFLFMDDLKLFSKSKEQTDILVRIAHAFSANIEMEFRMKKCKILTMKRGKVVRCEVINLPNS